ncbi:TIR domain-containing protein [Psychrobacillus sp. FSL K6-4615]|uniref:TIR domain-containing protein n=1 Tax=Psychrobacillus sp. FSL K6-4615 TaxID=2921551 RepID=UPI0030F52A6C
MAYRNGVYAAFDGQGKTNPSESDIRYFNLLKGWAAKEDFNYIDSHKKTNVVRDTSLPETLKRALNERLSNSKVMIIILSNDTNYDRGFLNYEIERALDHYKLPLILTYPDVGVGEIQTQWATLERRWPRALRERITDNSRNDLSCLHIKFNKNDIMSALEHMTVHNKKYLGPKIYLEYK